MEIITTQKYLRLSPSKIRPLAKEIKKLSPQKAIDTLPFMGKRASFPLVKVIKSALAIAKEKGISEKDLIFKEIRISEGPRLKRGTPISRGRWHPIVKRMSHIRVVLETTKSEVINQKSIPVKTSPVVEKGNKVEKKEGDNKWDKK